MTATIFFSLIARLSKSSTKLLGSYSTKAGNFRDIAWQLVVQEGLHLEKDGRQRAYQTEDYVFHLKRYDNILILCLVSATTRTSKVSNFLHVVHSQFLITVEQESRTRRRRRRPDSASVVSGLYDAVSVTSAVLQRCMAWVAEPDSHKQLMLRTKTQAHNNRESDGDKNKNKNKNKNKMSRVKSRSSRTLRANTGMLLPMGFGDASTGTGHHPLDNLNSHVRAQFYADNSAAKSKEDYLKMLHKHRGFLLRLPLPNTKPTTEDQAFKDSVRETFTLNGMRIEGHRALDMMRRLEEMIAPFAFSTAARAKTALDVLRAASRTTTGGDSYFLTSTLFGRPGVMVTAGHVGTPMPIDIRSTKRGNIVIRTFNIFELHDEEALMDGGTEDCEPIIVLTTETVESIDCITGNAKRVLLITSDNLSKMAFKYRIRGAGIPHANGLYVRHGAERIFANQGGYFLTYTTVGETDIGGGRLRLEEHRWILFRRSQENVCYACTVSANDEASSAGWLAVNEGGGVPPNPTVTVIERGYAPVSREDLAALFVETREEEEEESMSLSSATSHTSLKDARREPSGSSDWLTGNISSPRLTITNREEDTTTVISSSSEILIVPEKDGLGGGVVSRRPSLVSQNSVIMKARDASAKREGWA
jgi:hypothetical protein